MTEPAEAEEFARTHVNAGYRSRDDIIDDVVSYCEEPITHGEAEALVGRLWAQRLAEARTWPERTDPDRLTSVFDRLNERGIVARENFACCRNCGFSEIGDEARDDSRGFVFFHSQDAENAANGHGLWLAYGTFSDSDDDIVAIGREVATALTEAGLPVVWDGTPEIRINITPLDWKKRLPE
jgi:hypothetical protein